jgi:hypothetical protein
MTKPTFNQRQDCFAAGPAQIHYGDASERDFFASIHCFYASTSWAGVHRQKQGDAEAISSASCTRVHMQKHGAAEAISSTSCTGVHMQKQGCMERAVLLPEVRDILFN